MPIILVGSNDKSTYNTIYSMMMWKSEILINILNLLHGNDMT